MRVHEDELTVGDDDVRALVDRQLPKFADLPLRRLLASGSSNVLFRLGDELLIRLPRRLGGSAEIDKEAAYLPLLASSIPVAVPTVVAVGEPDLGYPERRSVVRWIDGEHPAVSSPSGPDSARLAQDLAATVTALHAAPVPPAARSDPALHWYRAGPLRAIDATIRAYLADCRAISDLPLDLDACERFWDDAMRHSDPPSGTQPRWVHADLLTENLLIHDGGGLAAVLDFGGLALGHPSVDLIVAWELLGAHDRDTFRSMLGVDDADWAWGRAWAFAIAVMTFPYYWHTLPQRCAHRLAMARAVLGDIHATAKGDQICSVARATRGQAAR